MKKKLLLLAVLLSAVFFEIMVINSDSRMVYFVLDEGENVVLSLKCDGGTEQIHPFFDEISGITWFFIPAFVKENTIYWNADDISVRAADGEPLHPAGNKLEWEEDNTYQISSGMGSMNARFMRSANLPSVFIKTASGSLDYLNEDKRNSEQGYIKVIENTGNKEYEGKLPRISERGNTTFLASKKSFAFTLKEKQPLCGLESGKKWNLLSLYFEQNKIQSKIIFEMADYLGLEYTPGCTWVDLYCNGRYEGLYLLTEAVTVGEGRVEIYDLEKKNQFVNGEQNLKLLDIIREETYSYYDIKSPADISGGYLIEKERDDRITEDDIYFFTEAGFCFTMKSPDNASREEVEYIADYIQKLEDMILEGDSGYKEYLDEDSFAKQFLIDKIVLEADAMIMSAFYYLDKGGVALKSGPIWDYDRAFGLILPDYTRAMEDYPVNEWYVSLYRDPEFQGKVVGYYRQLLPYIEKILETGIDEYVEWVSASLRMDRQKWGNTGEATMIYRNHESYVRYLKYFLIKRTEYLNKQWDISCDLSSYYDFHQEEKHTVTFEKADGSKSDIYLLKDGQCMYDLPELSVDDRESGWYFEDSSLKYNEKIPVFEDMVLIERK